MSGSISGSASHNRPSTIDESNHPARQTPPRSESPTRQGPAQVPRQAGAALSGLTAISPNRPSPVPGGVEGDTASPSRRAPLPPRTASTLTQGSGAAVDGPDGGAARERGENIEMTAMGGSGAGVGETSAASTHSFDSAPDLEAGNGGGPQPNANAVWRYMFPGGQPRMSFLGVAAVLQRVQLGAPAMATLTRLMNAIGDLPQAASGLARDARQGIEQGAQRGYAAASEMASASYTATQQTLTPLAHAAQAHAGHIARNDYGEDRPVMGWVANALAAGSHELVATGGATALRELVAAGIETALKNNDVSSEVKGAAVAVLITMAAAGKLLAIQHKRHKGVSTTMSNVGDTVQLMSLIGVGVGAFVTGRNQQGNGQLGVLSQLLPNAIKSFVYLVRDVINMAAPLKGNHDAGYQRPVATQVLDSAPYLPNQFGVNEVQGFKGLSGAGAADLLHAGGKLGSAEARELIAYVGANAGGEAVDAVGLRVASEVMTHGVTPKALEEVKNLRMKWTAMDTSTESVESQLADKMAGSGSARLALFLGIYGLSAIAASFLDDIELSEAKRNHAENALGALVIVAGCIPFAMATATKDAPRPVTV